MLHTSCLGQAGLFSPRIISFNSRHQESNFSPNVFLWQASDGAVHETEFPVAVAFAVSYYQLG